jgi:hypothetical protein
MRSHWARKIFLETLGQKGVHALVMPLPHQSTDPNQPDRQQADDAQYYRQVLHELIDMGAGLARALHQQATAEAANPTNEAAPDPTIAFDRIARTIRRTIALARHVAEPLPERANYDASRAQHRTAARKQIIRAVEDAIESKVHGTAYMDDEEADGLRAELMDRLDGPDLDGFALDRPVADLIADICRDLGLAAAPGTHPWKRRTPDDIAILCARAAAPRPPPTSPSVIQAMPSWAWPSSDPPAAPA